MIEIKCHRCKKVFPVDYDGIDKVHYDILYSDRKDPIVYCLTCQEELDQMNAWFKQELKDREFKLKILLETKKEEWLKCGDV